MLSYSLNSILFPFYLQSIASESNNNDLKDQLEKATSELKDLKNNPAQPIDANKDLMENLTSTKHELLKTRVSFFSKVKI